MRSATPRGGAGGRTTGISITGEVKITIITSKEHGEVREGPRPTEVVGGALDIQHAGALGGAASDNGGHRPNYSARALAARANRALHRRFMTPTAAAATAPRGRRGGASAAGQ